MSTYLVVWRQDHDNFIHSEVDLGIVDPMQMSNNEWVTEAAKSEGYTAEELSDLLRHGYELILAVPMPSIFYV
jgi:predicted DNA-binding protein (MmcQ/YjbR family)